MIDALCGGNGVATSGAPRRSPTDEKAHTPIAFPSGEGGGVCRRMRRDDTSVTLDFVLNLILSNSVLLIAFPSRGRWHAQKLSTLKA